MNKLTIEQLNLLEYMYPRYIEKDNKRLYFKEVQENELGSELVVEKLAKKVGITTPHYEMFTSVDGSSHYYFCESLSKLGDFSIAKSLGVSYDEGNIDVIIDDITDFYALSIDKIREELYKIYFFDILINNIDRTPGNWGIVTLPNRDRTVCILDNENSFYDSESNTTHLTSMNDNNYVLNNIYDLSCFLDTHDDKYRTIFIDMYKMLTPEYLSSVIDDILKSGICLPYKDKWLEYYTRDYSIIGESLYKNSVKKSLKK